MRFRHHRAEAARRGHARARRTEYPGRRVDSTCRIHIEARRGHEQQRCDRLGVAFQHRQLECRPASDSTRRQDAWALTLDRSSAANDQPQCRKTNKLPHALYMLYTSLSALVSKSRHTQCACLAPGTRCHGRAMGASGLVSMPDHACGEPGLSAPEPPLPPPPSPSLLRALGAELERLLTGEQKPCDDNRPLEVLRLR